MSFSRNQLELKELVFGAHFHVEITAVPQLGEKFYREITKVRNDLFTTKFIQPGMPFVFIHEKFRTQCSISDNTLIYTEKHHFDSDRFKKVSYALIKKLVEVFECSEDNFKIIGKVYRYRLNIPKIFQKFKEGVTLFAGEELIKLDLRTAFKERKKTIHIHLSNVAKEGELDPDAIFVECDINTSDQTEYHSLSKLEDVFRFADDYNNKRLIPFLSSKLGLS